MPSNHKILSHLALFCTDSNSVAASGFAYISFLIYRVYGSLFTFQTSIYVVCYIVYSHTDIKA